MLEFRLYIDVALIRDQTDDWFRCRPLAGINNETEHQITFRGRLNRPKTHITLTVRMMWHVNKLEAFAVLTLISDHTVQWREGKSKLIHNQSHYNQNYDKLN